MPARDGHRRVRMNDKNPILRSPAMIEERIQEKLTVKRLQKASIFPNIITNASSGKRWGTAVYTRKHMEDMPEEVAFYTQLWDFTTHRAVKLASRMTEGAATREIVNLLQESCDGMTVEAERLGIYGGPIHYLAEAINAPLKYLS